MKAEGHAGYILESANNTFDHILLNKYVSIQNFCPSNLGFTKSLEQYMRENWKKAANGRYEAPKIKAKKGNLTSQRESFNNLFPFVKISHPIRPNFNMLNLSMDRNMIEEYFFQIFFQHDLFTERNKVLLGAIEICFGRIFHELEKLGIKIGNQNLLNFQHN